jgi:hypothetical protein
VPVVVVLAFMVASPGKGIDVDAEVPAGSAVAVAAARMTWSFGRRWRRPPDGLPERSAS